MFHKFEHYSNVNCVFTRAYVSLSNKYKGIDSLATLSDGLSLNINSESFNFKWKLLEAIPIKVKQEGIIWWQCFLMAVVSLPVYFDVFSFRINFSKCSHWCIRRWRFVSQTSLQILFSFGKFLYNPYHPYQVPPRNLRYEKKSCSLKFIAYICYYIYVYIYIKNKKK